MRIIDRIGQRYERLVVTARAPNKSEKDTNARWHCKCDCGRMCIAYGQDLARGKFKSCGCLNAERIYKHGMSRTPVYKIWKGIHSRCNNDTEHNRNYAARGIFVDPGWDDFEVFYADMGDPPKGMSLERMDNDGPYSKANCCWADRKTQLNNQRRSRRITAFGKTQTIAQWSDETGIDWHTIRERLDRRGWPAEEALRTDTQPGKALQNR